MPDVPHTRRTFLVSAAATVASLSAAEPLFAATPAARFRSRPDLTPPTVRIDTPAARGVAGGYVLAAPFTGTANGTALILGNDGEPIWIHQSPNLIMNFRVQRFGGAPVLTWWEGRQSNGYFEGECVIADQTYKVIKRIATANGLAPEVHEFLITSRDTALVSSNAFVTRDLTPYDGPPDGTVVDGVVQEIDIATGKVLFEWHSVDHVGLGETQFAAAQVWDYFHLNSIDVDPADGNLVVSARNTSAIYKLDRTTGDVMWRLGGTRGDFALEDGGTFWFQHDARARPGGLLSLFDDGADAPNDVREPVSRVLVLSLDMKAMTANVAASLPNPTRNPITYAMGNAQQLAHGGFFVSWGTTPQISELAKDGSLLLDATFPGGQTSYRAFRAQWPGRAPGVPAVATVRNASSTDVYVSWNGSTRVAGWRVLDSDGKQLRTAARSGFETRIRVDGRPAALAVAAVDAQGHVLATSPAVRP